MAYMVTLNKYTGQTEDKMIVKSKYILQTMIYFN